MQPYPREENGLRAKPELFPRLDPPLRVDLVQDAIKKAFKRANKTKTGQESKTHDDANKLVRACLKHLKERNDPILSISFYSNLNTSEIFAMDGIPHEMQRLRMKMGTFYQFLLIYLMRNSKLNPNSPIIETFDGLREGDVYADIRTPTFDYGLRLYISVKKSIDTVGGQDIGDAIKRLESVAKNDKNLNSPYLCVIAVATPTKGKVGTYDTSRQIRHNIYKHPYSMNCEIWSPGFLFPYITGHSAIYIYRQAKELINEFFTFYSLQFRTECSELLKNELIKLGIVANSGKIINDAFFEYLVHESKIPV
jgi:hypothetical protein